MKLQGETILKGDRVFHKKYGYLKVMTVGQNTFSINIPNIGLVIVDGDGRLAGNRAIYWHDPDIVLPVKDLAKWGVIVRSCRATALAIMEGM